MLVTGAGSGHRYVGDPVHGVSLVVVGLVVVGLDAGLGDLHLIPFALAGVVGGLGIMRALQRVAADVLRRLQRHRHAAFAGVVVLGRGALLVRDHLTLLPQQALQQRVGCQALGRGARTQLMETVEVAGAHRQPPLARAGGRVLVGRGAAVLLQVALAQALRHPPVQARMLRGQGLQKVTEGLTQQPQTRQHRDVAEHMGGVQTLPGDLRTQRLENAIRSRLEGLPAAVMGQQASAEVVQRQDVVSPRLLRQVGLVRGQLQGVLPQQAELQLLQRLDVGQRKHLLEQKHAQDRRHRLVGTTVVVAIQGRELFFVDQRQGVRAKGLGPARLQAPLLGRRHQVATLEQGALRILLTKHQPHPLERKCVTDWNTPIYQESLIIGAVREGFLRENQ